MLIETVGYDSAQQIYASNSTWPTGLDHHKNVFGQADSSSNKSCIEPKLVKKDIHINLTIAKASCLCNDSHNALSVNSINSNDF